MSAVENISTVVVVGAGLTAWTVAAALKRRIPSLAVTLVPSPVSPDAIADRIISTLPSIQGFHQDIGLTDQDTIVGAQSGFRLGTSFDGWAEGLPAYVHAYGAYGAPVGGVAFHQLWIRDHSRGSLPPFDHFSPAAEFARSGRSPDPAFHEIEYGLQLDLERYGELMRAYAEHLGVELGRSQLVDVELRSSDGFIEGLLLDGGVAIEADLYVDCTGPTALLHSRLDSQFIDWNHWLFCDRMILADTPFDESAVALDRVSALPFGWRWIASSPQRSSAGLAYSSAHSRAQDIDRELGNSTGQAIGLRQGRRQDFWVKNCVAVGDSAVTIEPLEWTNLHLAHSQIDRVVSMMPGRDCSAVELAEFNRQCAAEADRVRDFVCAHYRCARRSEPFWKDAAAVEPPPSLAHTLSLFAERGRLPYHEEETFSRDSWLLMLLGQGFEPRRVDPMADLVSPAQAERAFASMRQSLSTFTLPSAGPELPDLNPRGIR